MHSLSIQYDNDLFTQTDRYYTQGIQLKYTSVTFNYSLLNRMMQLLPVSKAQTLTISGIKLTHAVFTPSDLGASRPLLNDRPYAGYLYLAYFHEQQDTLLQQILTTELQVGVMGRPAFAEGMQKTIHDVVNGEQPQGWDNQIAPDAIVGYTIKYEKAVLGRVQQSCVGVFGEAALGTLITSLSIGAKARLDNYSIGHPAKLRLQVYASSQVKGIAYNATLQGGIFNPNSVYTIDQPHLNRWLLHHNIGGQLTYANLSIGYVWHFLSPEFTWGETHRWGSIWLEVGF